MTNEVIYTIVQRHKHRYYVKADYGTYLPTQYGPFYSLRRARKWVHKEVNKQIKKEYPRDIEKYNDKGELI